ncbi:MAG: glycogen-binding domain-containing protein [Elusimicrobia bacterium]|nr:glycogen-binding domain-containing protein [Elusimicrobiota bacterium]
MMEKKSVLLTVALLALIIVSVPSVLFNNAIQKYFKFVNSWSVATIKPSRLARLPETHYRGVKYGEPPQPELRFIKFSVRLRGAKKVKVAADFNKWDPDALELVKKGKNVWETIVPLPPGVYRYLYNIDGQSVLDPMNPDTDMDAGRKVSLLTVK